MRWALVAVAACSPVDRGPSFDLPSEIAWAGMIGFDVDRRIASSTGLSDVRDRALEITAPDDLDRLLVLGFTAGDLDAYALDDTPLRARAEGEPLIPHPSYAAEAGPGDGAPTPFEGTPQLTADWLDLCPDFTELEVQIDCALTNCTIGRTQNGCRLELDPAACMSGTFGLQFSPDGDIVWADAELYSSCTATTAPGAAAAFRCLAPAECTVSFSAEDLRPAFTVEHVRPFPADRVIGARYLSSVVVLGDRALVVSFGGAAETRFCDNPIARFIELDLTGGTSPPERDAPPCLMHLTRWSGGFIGSFGTGDRHLGWFDANGELIASIPLPAVQAVHSIDLEGDRAFILGQLELQGPHRIMSVDLTSRTLERDVAVDRMNQKSVVVGRDELLIADDQGDLARFIDRNTLEERGSLALSSFLPFSVEIKSVVYHPRSDLFLALIGSTFAGVTVFDETRILGRTVSFEEDVEPTSAIPWPTDPSRVLLALVNRHGGPPRMQLLDPKARRYVSSAEEVGDIGPVVEMDAGPRYVVGIAEATPDLVIIRPIE